MAIASTDTDLARLVLNADNHENPAPQLVIVGDTAGDSSGISLLAQLRIHATTVPPILYLGDASQRAEALAAGATQCMPRPAFVRDVVTVGRLLAGRKRRSDPQTFGCSLAQCHGLYYVVRALSAAEWTGVLTMVRGMRRGELRLYAGEVTSAQAGTLHGLAALHQLLLWADAKVELRFEEVVRRQQIPLTPDELLADAERFLNDIRTESRGISPSWVYGPVFEASQEELPAEVIAVLRLFDGVRTIADITEDSPFRAFETLRIVHGLLECRVIDRVTTGDRNATGNGSLAMEEWLVGAKSDSGEVAASARPSPQATAAATQSERADTESRPKQKKKRKKKGKRSKGERAKTAPPELAQQHSTAGTVSKPDWSKIIPTQSAAEPCAAVVPAMDSAGTIGDSEPAGPTEAAVETAHAESATAHAQHSAGAEAKELAHELAEAAVRARRAASSTEEASEAPTSGQDHLDTAGSELATAAKAGPSKELPTERPQPTCKAQVLSNDAASVAADAARIAEVAAHFTEDERAFFRSGEALHKKPLPKLETFEDLDDEPPRGFWNRMLTIPGSYRRKKK